MTGRYLTIEEASYRLGTNARVVRELIRKGELPALRVTPRCIRIHNSEIDYYKAGVCEPSTDANPQRVYFLRGRATGLVKIGRARNVAARLRDIQAMSPDALDLLGTMSESFYSEPELHRRFAGDRAHGEWFQPSDDLVSFIRDCAEAP